MIMKSGKTLILGIGNTLLTDEGAGIHAMELLQSQCDDIPGDLGLTFLDGGTLSFTLASWIEDHDALIVFDAAQLNKPAGTVESYIGEDMDAFLGRSKHSAHEVGLLDLMDIARLTGHLPSFRALIAIQPENMTWGMQTSDAVTPALAIAAHEALAIINNWHGLSATTDTGKADRAIDCC